MSIVTCCQDDIRTYLYLACVSDDILRALKNPQVPPLCHPFVADLHRSRIGGASSFCSSYIFPSSASSPVLNTSQIVQSPLPLATTTSVCGNTFPASSTLCGLEAYGFQSYLIIQFDKTRPTDCHLSCLADWNCKSFQVQVNSSRYCNLYSSPVSGNVQAASGSGYFAYDKMCSNYLPVSKISTRCCSIQLRSDVRVLVLPRYP